jgi:hypothetical protein
LSLLFLFSSCSEEKISGEDFGTVEGRVVSAITFKPFENVKVFQTQVQVLFFTDSDGRFLFQKIKAGQYSFEAQKTVILLNLNLYSKYK